jgi:hypothetical protein
MSGLWPTVCRVSFQPAWVFQGEYPGWSLEPARFQLFRWLDERAEEENPVRKMAQAAYRARSGQGGEGKSGDGLPLELKVYY